MGLRSRTRRNAELLQVSRGLRVKSPRTQSFYGHAATPAPMMLAFTVPTGVTCASPLR